MQGTLFVLFPPLFVIICVLTTRRMVLSFLLGILFSALLVTHGNPIEALKLSGARLWANTGIGNLTSIQSFFASWNLMVFLFLIILGSIIALLSRTGAAQAYIKVAQRYVTSKKGVEIASLILSLFFFIDDYFSALTVGSVMRPLADRFKVHPVKLAFLTTAMATPITLLSPLSSWVGEIILQLKQVGVGPAGPRTVIASDPYIVLISAIPSIIYALLLIISTWYIVLRGISYGPMRYVDQEQAPATPSHEITTSFIDFLLPIVVLIAGVFFMILFTGNYYLLGGTNDFVTSVKEASIHQALFVGGFVSLIVSSGYFLIKGYIMLKGILAALNEGFHLMFSSIVVLICAWSLGTILKNDLQTGAYVAMLVSSFINLELFPLICFLIAACISWMLGSAWATIGLMFPIVIGMLQKLLQLPLNTPAELVPLLIPIVGATLSGCIIGTQLSVIADNPIMSSASTGAPHIEHIKTMAWYVIPVGLASALSFLIIGISLQSLGTYTSILLGLSIGLISAILLLELGQYFFGGRHDRN